MNSNICIITGATDGIGKTTAVELAEKGFILGLVGRDRGKGKKVVKEISNLTGNNAIHYFNADLSLMSENKRISLEIKNKFPVIDILINNVGAAFFKKTFTEEGFETTFALNHLSYFLFTKLLLKNLNKQCSRIVNVASDAHFGAKLDFSDIQGVKSYEGYPNYKKSKLMNILFSYELADRLKNTSTTVNCLHPGFVSSKFGHNNSGLKVILLRIAQKLQAINVKDGAKTSVYLASSTDIDVISGKYFYKKKVKESSPESNDIDSRKRLWDITEKLLEDLS